MTILGPVGATRASPSLAPGRAFPVVAAPCERRYHNVMPFADLALARRLERAEGTACAHLTDESESALWTEVGTAGWTAEHPELRDFLRLNGAIAAARTGSLCFLAELDGQPGAAGVLCIHEGVALFGGASTVPALRRRGLQAALLEERMRVAHERGCDLAMMAAEVGSDSQRNTERKGFRIAYTRTKWRLMRSDGQASTSDT